MYAEGSIFDSKNQVKKRVTVNDICNLTTFVDFVDVTGCSVILKDIKLNMIRNLK